ncbi:MAG TPA: HD domain-containing protein [Limnochordia bacterium]|nr:HD domain-containing protein [Limnochordia bacterium]
MALHFLDDALLGLMAALDEETIAHCGRVQTLALTLGELMGLQPSQLLDLRLGAYIHDIGKQYIPESILKKKAPLTPQEWALIEQHPRWGYDLVAPLNLGEGAKRIVLEHHLWANGQGDYPQELIGTKPCLLAQIATVADVVDAMSSHRAYRQALSVAASLEYLEEHAGTKFNAEIVAMFKAEIYPFLRKSG